MMVKTADLFTLVRSSGLSTSFGKFNGKAVDWLMVVVNVKKVMSRKPRSTMGVRSTRAESFLFFFIRDRLLQRSSFAASISAIKIYFSCFAPGINLQKKSCLINPINSIEKSAARLNDYSVKMLFSKVSIRDIRSACPLFPSTCKLSTRFIHIINSDKSGGDVDNENGHYT